MGHVEARFLLIDLRKTNHTVGGWAIVLVQQIKELTSRSVCFTLSLRLSKFPVADVICP